MYLGANILPITLSWLTSETMHDHLATVIQKHAYSDKWLKYNLKSSPNYIPFDFEQKTSIETSAMAKIKQLHNDKFTLPALSLMLFCIYDTFRHVGHKTRLNSIKIC